MSVNITSNQYLNEDEQLGRNHVLSRISGDALLLCFGGLDVRSIVQL